MFSTIIFICLMIFLFLTGGAALHMGVFKSHEKEKSLAVKTVTGILSYGISGVYWFLCYGFHYLRW